MWTMKVIPLSHPSLLGFERVSLLLATIFQNKPVVISLFLTNHHGYGWIWLMQYFAYMTLYRIGCQHLQDTTHISTYQWWYMVIRKHEENYRCSPELPSIFINLHQYRGRNELRLPFPAKWRPRNLGIWMLCWCLCCIHHAYASYLGIKIQYVLSLRLPVRSIPPSAVLESTTENHGATVIACYGPLPENKSVKPNFWNDNPIYYNIL